MTQYLGVAKAARLLGISRVKLQVLIRSGDLVTFEGKVDAAELYKRFPGLALNDSEIVERANIIKDSAYGDRIQGRAVPSTDVLQTQIKCLNVDLNVERAKARHYHDIVQDLLHKLTELQQVDNEQQRLIIKELNIWLLARFDAKD